MKAPEEPKSCLEDLTAVNEAKFSLSGDLGPRTKAVLTGTVHLRELAKKLDTEVATVCSALAQDLGQKDAKPQDSLPPGKKATAACEQAAEAIKKKREEDGVVMLVYPYAPTCTVDLADYGRCVRQCDSNVPPDSSAVQCDVDSSRGRCSGKCQGQCVESFTESCKGTCRGVCRGGCDDQFFGKCGGRCIGTCDGASVSGKCDGVCDGKCSSDADGSCQGTCKGKCSGTCLSDIKKTSCGGTCAGTCSEALGSERCGVVITPPEMTPACGAMCDADLADNLQCVGGYVDAIVYHETKAGAGEKLKEALAKRLDVLLAASEGSGPAIERAHMKLEAAFEGIDESLQADPDGKKRVDTCLGDAKKQRKDAAEAVEMIREVAASVIGAVKG